MNRKQICEILNISNSTITLILSGKRKSPKYEHKIRYLLSFEDSFEAIIRDEAFGELCTLVINRGLKVRDASEIELALNGRNMRTYLMNKFNLNDLHHSLYMVFDRTTFLDRKMKDFMTNPAIETMCDIAMRGSKKITVRQMATTLKLIHQEFWKPKNDFK